MADIKLFSIKDGVKELESKTVTFEDGFSRDVTGIGHWGTGDVEVSLKNSADFEKVKALIERAYNEN